MPTNEERKQIAENLRMYARVTRDLDVACWLLNAVEPNGMECDEIGSCENCFNYSLNRLADLIEPEERTCRIVGMDAAGNPPYNKSGLNLNATSAGCSECGFPFSWCRSLIQARNEVVACPNCGAKVTGGATCGN